MSEPFIGEIRMFAGSFAPRDWAYCDGQLLPISQNESLYSIIGTIYGGDGRTNFALPDLRGRVPIHVGANHNIGNKGGQESANLQATELDTGGRTNSAINTGAHTSIPIMQPTTCVGFIICLNGNYPSRN